MELVEGQNLRETLSNGPMPTQKLLDMFRRLKKWIDTYRASEPL